MRAIRGRPIGLVPQDPMSNLNPVAKIGTQVAETLLAHGLATRKDVDGKVVETLEAAGLPERRGSARSSTPTSSPAACGSARSSRSGWRATRSC